jgi:hypothetical protein
VTVSTREPCAILASGVRWLTSLVGSHTPSVYGPTNKKKSPYPSRDVHMAKLGERAICGPDFFYLTCLRCRTSVCIKDIEASVKLMYDVDDWQRSNRCCSHLEGPVSCCSFAELRQAIKDLPIQH